MPAQSNRSPGAPFHYAWVIAGVTFVVLLVTAGIRATPGVLMVPLEEEFGWNRAVISAAVAINIALFGLIGPFAASVMDRWGMRRVMLAAAALLAISVALSTGMRSQWQLTLPEGQHYARCRPSASAWLRRTAVALAEVVRPAGRRAHHGTPGSPSAPAPHSAGAASS